MYEYIYLWKVTIAGSGEFNHIKFWEAIYIPYDNYDFFDFNLEEQILI